MNWVKIEAGCEMPKDDEFVLVGAKFGYADAICEDGRIYHTGQNDQQVDSVHYGFTHWCYVELPNN